MQQFIQTAAQKLGIPEPLAQTITAKILEWVKENVGGEGFGELLNKLPGAGEMMESEQSKQGGEETPSEGGVLGGLMKMASSVLGGKAGEGAELLGIMQGAGLDAEQSGSFLTMLIDFIKEKAGSEVLDQLAKKFPALKQIFDATTDET